MKTRKTLSRSKIFTICTCIIFSLILMLALCIFNTGAADLPHIHRACGEAFCTHTGEVHSPVVWTELNQTIFDSCYDPELGYYAVPEGNYYLSGNIKTSYPTRITGKTSLCLNGFIMDFNSSRSLTIANDLSVCDCSSAQTGIIDGTNAKTEADSGAVFNLYSGTIGGSSAYLSVSGGTTLNMYGGTIESVQGDAVMVLKNATMNQYGGVLTGLRFSIYLQGTYNMYDGYLSQYNSDPDAASAAALYAIGDSTANIFKGSMTSSGYGIYCGGSNMTISPKENTDVVVHGAKGAMQGNSGVNTFVCTINGGTFTSDSDMAIYVGTPTVINNAPDIQGTLQLKIRSVAEKENEYLLDVSGYTGEEKLQVDYKRPPVEDFALIKGNTSQVALINEGWTLEDGTDTAESPNAVLVLKEIVYSHIHKVCGEESCTHAGDGHTADVEYTELDQALFDSWYDDTVKKYVIPAGNWCLVENIVLTDRYDETTEGSGRVTFAANEITSLCLNGKALDLGGNALYAFGVESGTVNICDCSEQQSGLIFSTVKNNYPAVLYTQNVNLYSGSIQSAPGGVAVQVHNDTFNMYDGSIMGENYGIHQIGLCTFNMYGGNVFGTAAAYMAYNGTANISGGILIGETYAINAEIMELNITNEAVIYSQGIGIFVNDGTSTYNENEITLTDAEIYSAVGQPSIYVEGDEMCKVTIGGNSFITGAIVTTVGTDANGEYYLDASGYTGNNPITIVLDSAAVVDAAVIAKGSARALSIANQNFALVSGKDENGNDIVKIASHTEHTAGDITCIGTFCTVCEQYYGTPDTSAHSFGELVAEVPATCMETGTKEHKECTLCGKCFDKDGAELTDLFIDVDNDAHAWDEGTIITAATCTTPGESLYVCEHNTEHTKTEVTFDADAHEWNNGVVTIAATCMAKGTRVFTCANNEQHIRSEEIAIDPAAHEWGEWARTADPTCTEVGKDTRTCAHNSAHTDTRDVEALGHDFSIEQQSETEKWNKCSRCDETDTPVELEIEKSGIFGGLFDGLFDGKLGCGSSVGGGIAVMISVSLIGAYMFKKKKD